MMKQGKGAIINFASDAAIAGMPNSALYAASKGAVIGWTRTIDHEWGIKYNIRTNIVNPTIKTPMYEKWLATAPKEMEEAHIKANKRSHPIGGALGEADTDMAPGMVFLASESSKYMTGQIFEVNGGSLMVR